MSDLTWIKAFSASEAKVFQAVAVLEANKLAFR